MQRTSWTVTQPDGEVVKATGEKHPYTKERLETDTMSASQKAFVREFNSMRSSLLKHNLMEKK